MMYTEPNFNYAQRNQIKIFENGFREHVKLIETKRIP